MRPYWNVSCYVGFSRCCPVSAHNWPPLSAFVWCRCDPNFNLYFGTSCSSLWFHPLALSWHWTALFSPPASHTRTAGSAPKNHSALYSFLPPLHLYRQSRECNLISHQFSLLVQSGIFFNMREDQTNLSWSVSLSCQLEIDATLQLRIHLISYSMWKILLILQGIIY